MKQQSSSELKSTKSFAIDNAVRSIARRLNTEIEDIAGGHPEKIPPAIMIGIISRYHAEIEPLGVTRTQLMYKIGVMNGRFIDRAE